MAYLKPQSPIKYKEDHIYPLTTIDQVVMEDGQRLSGVGVYLDRPEEGEETTVAGTNADTFGGKLPSEYLGKDEQGRYNFADTGRFVFTKEFIERGKISLEKEYDGEKAFEIYANLQKNIHKEKKKKGRER